MDGLGGGGDGPCHERTEVVVRRGDRENVYYYNGRLNEKSSTPIHTPEDLSFFILTNLSIQFPRQLIPVQKTLPL